MKSYYSHIRFITVAAALWCASASTTAQELHDQDFCNKFAFKLYQAVDKLQESNIAFSPVSAEIALASLHNISSGEALHELQKALGTEGYSIEEVNLYNQALINALKQTVEMPESDWYAFFYNDFAAPKIAVSNTIWFNTPIAYTNYIYWKPCCDYYKARFYGIDFTKKDLEAYINAWTSTHSNGMIPPVDIELDDEAPFYFVNALAFQGRWVHDFLDRDPEEADFTNSDNTTSTVKYMNLRKRFVFAETENFDMVGLHFWPYSTRRFSMNLYLPKKDDAVFNFDEYTKLQNKACDEDIQIYLPQFSITNQLKLKETLSELGVHGVFETGNTDLFPASTGHFHSNDAYIHDILQPCRVEINAYGTMVDKYILHLPVSLGDNTANVTLRFDHPFYYTIEDHENHVILLMGKVNNLGNTENGSNIDDPSDIEAPVINESRTATYDLSGRSVNSSLSHGLYIENGRKVIR